MKPNYEPLWNEMTEDFTFSKEFKLTDSLFKISNYKYTLEDVYRGFLIYGQTGSGKTSGSGKYIASNYLRLGFGGLVLCAKKDEAVFWESLANKHKRVKSIIRVSANSTHRFNYVSFFKSILSHYDESTKNTLLANMFFMAIKNAGYGFSSSDSFWENALKQLIINIITILNLSDEEIIPENMYRLLISIPKTSEEGEEVLNYFYNDQEIVDNYFTSLIKKIDNSHELDMSVSYFCKDYACLVDKTRSIIFTSLTSLLEELRREPLRSHFQGESNVTPDIIFSGAIIVIDYSVHEWQSIGKIVNNFWKYAFQIASQNRINKRPCFLWADEAHYFLNSFDTEYQSTARSSCVSTVYLTQNISIQRSAFQSNNIKDHITALTGNLCNIIFHRNNDPETNEYAIKLFGQYTKSKTKYKDKNLFFNPKEKIKKQIISLEDILRLKTGGKQNNYKVEGYILKPGKFIDRKTKVKFGQKRPVFGQKLAKLNYPFTDVSDK